MDDDLTKAYCDAWHKSFQKENPFHTVKLNEETKSHIVAGLNAVLDVLMRRSGVAAVAIVDKFIPSCEIQYTEVAFHGLTHGTRLYPPEAIAQLQAKNEALSAEVERLTQDRNEWQESCLMANDNAVREERRRRDMQEERDQLRAELAAIRATEADLQERLREYRTRAHQAEQAYLSAPTAKDAGLVADGWKLVPVEPTTEMLFHGRDVFGEYVEDTDSDYRRIYRAMLAASPKLGGV